MFTFKLHVIVNHFNHYHNYGGRGGLLMSRVADNKTKKVILGVNWWPYRKCAFSFLSFLCNLKSYFFECCIRLSFLIALFLSIKLWVTLTFQIRDSLAALFHYVANCIVMASSWNFQMWNLSAWRLIWWNKKTICRLIAKLWVYFLKFKEIGWIIFTKRSIKKCY